MGQDLGQQVETLSLLRHHSPNRSSSPMIPSRFHGYQSFLFLCCSGYEIHGKHATACGRGTVHEISVFAQNFEAIEII